MSKILIVGCGDIGCRLAKILSAQGHDVLGVKRNPLKSEHKNIKFLALDINKSEDLDHLNLDFSTVFFMPTPDFRSRESYEKIYSHGLEKLLVFFSGTKQPPHFFFISSTSVYGQQQGEWIDENSLTEPERETAQVIVTAEQLIWQYNPKNTVVRFSGIYGLGRSQLLKKLESKNKIQNTPPYFTNRIHQDDCAAVLGFLFNKLLNGEQIEPCYLASDDDPATIWDILTWLAVQTGKAYPQALDKQSASKQNKRCRNTRLKQLGYRFIYPDYRAGYQSVLKEYTNE